MIKRRNRGYNEESLLGTHTTSKVDGSGRSVNMDAPIVRAAKNATPYTRYSYVIIALSLSVMWYSWRCIWWNYATTYVSCEGDNCTLKILPPHRAPQLTLEFHREQIVASKAVKVDEDGNLIQNDDRYDNRKSRSSSSENDDDGSYDSYAIVLNQYGKDAGFDHKFELQRAAMERQMKASIEAKDRLMKDMERYGSAAMTDPDLLSKFEAQKKDYEKMLDEQNENIDRVVGKAGSKRYDLPSLEALDSTYKLSSGTSDYAIHQGEGQYMIVLRKYNIGHKRRRVSALVNKVNYYAKGRKQSLTVRENRQVVWSGVLGMVIGFFSVLLSLLLGQFYDAEDSYRTKKKKSQPIVRSTGGNANNPYHSSSRGNFNAKAYGGYKPNNDSYNYSTY